MGSIVKSCVAVLMCLLVGATTVHATPNGCGIAQSRCNAGKYKCASKLTSCLLKYYRQAFVRGVAVEEFRLANCRADFSDPASGRGCIEKLDTHYDDCSTLGDGPALRAKVEAHVLDVVDRLVPSGSTSRNRCAGEKMKCFSSFDSCLLTKLASAAVHGPTCPAYAPCNAPLTGPKSCFERVERLHRPGSAQACQTVDDQAVMKDFDDAFVNDLIDSISGGGNDMRTRRCTNDTSMQCTDDTPCAGGGGTCASYFGAPLPMSVGGVATCVTNQWSGALSGTYDPATGAMVGSAKLLRRVYIALTLDHPCPTCDGVLDVPNDGISAGTCTGGTRNGLPCDGNGESPQTAFGTTSFECPPSPGLSVSTSAIAVDHTNDGLAAGIVTSDSPSCSGQPGKTCLCGSCSGDATVACRNDAECALAGVGTCTNSAGATRRVNACIDDSSGDGLCVATGNDQGACDHAPVDQTCAIDSYRGCLNNADCPTSGDLCMAPLRPCYPGYDGNVGDAVTATGRHQVPRDHTAAATLASVFCVPPTTSSAVNFSHGLPGPGRLALRGVTTDDGTASACPQHVTFTPTTKNGGWDIGWMGLAFKAKAVGQGKVTMAISGCANPIPPCGACNYSGPVEN